MENLEHDVVDATLEAVSGPVCPLKKALPVLAPVALVVGLVLLGTKWFKGRKAKKALVQPKSEEVDPGKTEE